MELLRESRERKTAALCRKHVSRKVRGTADPSASLGMTKERATVSKRVVAGPMSSSSPWMAQRQMAIPVEMSDENVTVQQPLFMRPLPFPLSSRAKPRDLQFRGPFVEMFFDRSVVEASAVFSGNRTKQ
jgi:hypothetical protein